MAVVCSIAFFTYEFIPQNSQEFKDALAAHKSAKAERTKALNALKKSQEGTPLYNEYYKQKVKTDRAFEAYRIAEQKEHFLAFDNLKQFLGEFGWALGLFIYSLFNVFVTFLRKEKKWPGEIALHGTLIFISFYFIAYCFKMKDFEAYQYIVSAFLMSCFIVTATYYLVRYKNQYISSLRRNNERLLRNIKRATRFIVRDTRKDWVPEEKNIEYTKQIAEFNNSLEPLE
ncbi:hypothetical protein [Aquimarina spongiae]|uniref:Uncharacterized protein n=1 Tax=Aquimarina spongiae TaxID=570521 RepID=A0A1M6JDR3_9FLAO|nr:hypothetical protein [Aquimarina spongiae]SHJ44851.1 hypothetical protein SAMN04488508_10910 [Aquimarina spongiae]